MLLLLAGMANKFHAVFFGVCQQSIEDSVMNLVKEGFKIGKVELGFRGLCAPLHF